LKGEIMKLNKSGILKVLSAVLVAAFALTGGCGGKGGVGGPGKGVDLSYKMNMKETLSYRMMSSNVQHMKVMGMEMEVNSDKKLAYTIRPEGQDGMNHRIRVTVDTLEVDIAGPQGNVSADAAPVLGKTFDMTLSPLGKESDLAGAKALKYDRGSGETISLAADFQGAFPDLAGHRIKMGDTWTTRDTLKVDESGGEIVIMLESVNTLAGYETVNGMECARITAVVVGSITGEGEQNGAQLEFDGTFEGNETWYFAYEEGLLVKIISDQNVLNTVKVSGPQNMEIPVNQTMKFETVLLN
jgi:hypothetical protein